MNNKSNKVIMIKTIKVIIKGNILTFIYSFLLCARHRVELFLNSHSKSMVYGRLLSCIAKVKRLFFFKNLLRYYSDYSTSIEVLDYL